MDTFTSVLEPATKEAADILSSFYIVLGVAAVIFVIVTGLVVYALIRFRRRKGREPKQFSENIWLEVLSTAQTENLLDFLSTRKKAVFAPGKAHSAVRPPGPLTQAALHASEELVMPGTVKMTRGTSHMAKSILVE